MTVHLTCHFQDDCATLVSLPFLPLQSASVCPRAAAGSVWDLQGIQTFSRGLKRALLFLLMIILQIFLRNLYSLFITCCKLLKKKKKGIILHHALLTDLQAMGLHTWVLPLVFMKSILNNFFKTRYCVDV